MVAGEIEQKCAQWLFEEEELREILGEHHLGHHFTGPHAQSQSPPFTPQSAGSYVALESIDPHWIQEALKAVPQDLQSYLLSTLPPLLQEKVQGHWAPKALPSKAFASFLAPYRALFYEQLKLLPAPLFPKIESPLAALLTMSPLEMERCALLMALAPLTPHLRTMIDPKKRSAFKEALYSSMLGKEGIDFIRYLQTNCFPKQKKALSMRFPLHLWDAKPSSLSSLMSRYGKGALARLVQAEPPAFAQRLAKNFPLSSTEGAPPPSLVESFLRPKDPAITEQTLSELRRILQWVLSFQPK